LTSTRTQFSHDAHCPEISPLDCKNPDFEIIDHEHHQSMTLTRIQSSLSMGLGSGWQAMIRLPVDIKFMTIDYTDHKGQPYTPPYGNFHHRNETLFGLGDGALQLQRFWRLNDAWVVGGGMGSILPLGRTEEDPYLLASKSQYHQHMQMGGGTFDPIASFAAIASADRWGLTVLGSGRMPLYDNSKGYRSSASAQLGLGPTLRITSKLMTTSDITAQHDEQASWASTPDPTSGRTAVTSGVSMIYRFSPFVALMGQGRFTLAQWSKEDQIVQRFIGSLGVSITPSGKKE
jgi:hypothetical protein